MSPYLPEPREFKKVPKQWIANVCATILGDTFTNWVSKQVEERNKKIVKDRGLGIQMDPRLA